MTQTMTRSAVRRPVRRERDLYDLALTTTPPAAAHFRDGQARLLRVQTGAEGPLRDAVAEDPDFAIGHAVLALLGHDFDVPMDVDAHLLAAARAAAAGTSRERSFTAAVVARVHGRPDRHERMLAHLADHPRDAVALSVAVPTIAFSGSVEVPDQAWALVDGVRRHYGSDPWFSGLHAFMLQEQGQFDAAGALAGWSLDQDPAGGQAAHAMTHVYYETGQHADGLGWLDGWITGQASAAAHRSHYSWHAALHELAMGDADAVRHRYSRELAPHAVRGIRALIDSASLLWRARVTGHWEGPLPIEHVLAVVDDEVLRRPATEFTALHAAVALAAARDEAGLRRLQRHAAGDARPAFRDVVAPLAAAMATLVRGRPGDAAEALMHLMPEVRRLGGSDAQREVVEETLIYTLVASSQFGRARAVLQRRLDRRRG